MAMKKAISLSILLLTLSLFYSCQKEDPASLPVISTSPVSNITTSTVTSGGTIVFDGDATVTASGVCWGTTANPTISDSKTSENVSIGQFVSNINGLSEGMMYHVRAYASNSVGTAYGADIEFLTLGQAPSCITLPATEIWLYNATLNGAVNPNSISTIVTFEYGITTSYGQTITSNQSPITGSDIVNVNANIAGLTLGTTYHFRVKTVNTFGTVYGGDMVFTTLPSLLLPPTNGLVAYYPFNGNANDESENGNNGTVNGATLTVDRLGSVNSAYSFNGTSNNYITVNFSTPLNTSEYSGITISSWCKLHDLSTPANPYNILSLSDNNLEGIWITYENPKFKSDNGLVDNPVFALNDANVNAWYNVVITIDNSNHSLKLYLNDIFQDEKTQESYMPLATKLLIGYHNSPVWGLGWYMNGIVDDIRIYDRVLSDAEILQLFHEGGW